MLLRTSESNNSEKNCQAYEKLATLKKRMESGNKQDTPHEQDSLNLKKKLLLESASSIIPYLSAVGHYGKPKTSKVVLKAKEHGRNEAAAAEKSRWSPIKLNSVRAAPRTNGVFDVSMFLERALIICLRVYAVRHREKL